MNKLLAVVGIKMCARRRTSYDSVLFLFVRRLSSAGVSLCCLHDWAVHRNRLLLGGGWGWGELRHLR